MFFFYLDDWDENAKMLCSLFANNTVLGTMCEGNKKKKKNTEQNMSITQKPNKLDLKE